MIERDPYSPVDVDATSQRIAKSLSDRRKYTPPVNEIAAIVSALAAGARVTKFVEPLAGKIVQERFPTPQEDLSAIHVTSGITK